MDSKLKNKVFAAQKNIDGYINRVNIAANRQRKIFGDSIIDATKKINAMSASEIQSVVNTALVESQYTNLARQTITSAMSEIIKNVNNIYDLNISVAADNINKVIEAAYIELQNRGTSIIIDTTKKLIDFSTQARAIVPSEILAATYTVFADNFTNVTNTLVQSMYRQYNNLYAESASEDVGAEGLYEFVGPDDDLTSDFCAELLGQVHTMAEWESMLNPGGYSVATFGGHPNCRHFLALTGFKNE